MSRSQRRAMIDREEPKLSLVRQCALLGISRSSLYYLPTEAGAEDMELMALIDQQYLKTPFYGSRRMTAWLRNHGHQVNRKRVRRLMQLIGLEAIYRRPNTSKPNPGHKVYPYLLRGLEINRVNQVWATDITYIPMARGFLYLVAIMDWHSRYVLAWRLSNTLEVDFCVAALEEALSKGRPQIFNTDQGSQFTSEAFTSMLLAQGVQVSMDGRGRCMDNVFVERLWRSIKYEEVYLKAYQNGTQARKGKHPGVPDDKAQRNFTDTESRIVPAPGGKDFLQAYNCQAVVDSAHQVIVAARATNQTSDKRQAAAMMEETIDNVGAVPREVSADAGYYSAKAVDELYALGVDPFVAPEQTRHGRVVPPAPRGRIPSHLSPRDRMRRKLQTRRGRQRYALRMQTVEPVFGQIKQGRGFRQFLLRGLEKVNGEWLLICTGHNLLKLFRFGVNLHRKARVDGPAQRIRNFAEVVEHGAIRKAIWGPAGATGKISCRDPLSLTRKHR